MSGGRLHPSLKVYIECYANPLMGKGWPRGGGLWDQDPMLVSHFRIIHKHEREWREVQDAQHKAKTGGDSGGPMGSVLDDYVKKLQEEGESTIL